MNPRWQIIFYIDDLLKGWEAKIDFKIILPIENYLATNFKV